MLGALSGWCLDGWGERGEIWGVTQGMRSPLPAETISTIVELRSQGLTLRAIAGDLTAQGIPTARGGKWEAATVKAVLNSPALKHAAQ